MRLTLPGWTVAHRLAPLLALLITPTGCGNDARISIGADIAPPLSLNMLTVTLRDRDRLLTWHGADFRSRPENATPSTGDQDIFTSGPDPLEGCFGCFGSAAFPSEQAYRAVDRDSVWLVWGGNSISDPAVF